MSGDPCPKVYAEKKAPKRLRSKRKTTTRARPDEPMADRCDICGESGPTQRHHKLRRSQGGGDEAANTMDLHGWCHDEVHRNPAHSFEQGYLIRSSEARKP